VVPLSAAEQPKEGPMSDVEYGVLVAVGADGVHDGALDFAVREAVRRGTGVDLVHVVHSLVAVPVDLVQMEQVDRSLSAVGNTVLTDAAARVRDRVAGRVPVTTELLTGPVAGTLAARASAAGLTVLERRDAGRLERLLTMSISTRVAAHTSAPVVVVPRSWSADDAAGAVTVGVDDPADALGQVGPAAAYAAAAGGRLIVLHAAWIPDPYQGVAIGADGEEWVAAARAELEKRMAGLDAPAPDEIDLEVHWQRPVDALVAASDSSGVLVLTRRRGAHPLGGHLGGITRAVLQHSRCPVLLVDRS
jgi:nucleotide-binding universal stress UspA family protein